MSFGGDAAAAVTGISARIKAEIDRSRTFPELKETLAKWQKRVEAFERGERAKPTLINVSDAMASVIEKYVDPGARVTSCVPCSDSCCN